MGEPMAWSIRKKTELDVGQLGSSSRRSGRTSGRVVFLPFRLARFLVFGRPTMPLGNGAALHSRGGQGSEQRLHSILEHEVEYLFCTPTYALRLPEAAKQAGIDLRGHALRSIIVAGETGGSDPSFRRRVSEAWGRSQACMIITG